MVRCHRPSGTRPRSFALCMNTRSARKRCVRSRWRHITMPRQIRRAVMRGRPLTEQAYADSRWITEPFHLFDCCQENDGAAAVILVSAEIARDMAQKPAFLLAAPQAYQYRCGSG